MRSPDNEIEIKSDLQEGKEETFKINSIDDFYIEDYDLMDEKDFAKYISNIEKIVRTSYEYRQFIRFLRENIDMNKCSFFSQVNNIESFKIKIHIHHEPITLYDIVLAVYNRRSEAHESLSEDMVAKEVMYNHYMLRVGLIPLSETVHELVHNQYLFIPTTAVFGKYWEFVDMYKDYIDDKTLETLEKIEETTKTYNMDDAKKLLETHLIHIDTGNKIDIDEIKKVLLEQFKK